MALKKKPVTGMKDMMPAEMEVRDYVIGQKDFLSRRNNKDNKFSKVLFADLYRLYRFGSSNNIPVPHSGYRKSPCSILHALFCTRLNQSPSASLPSSLSDIDLTEAASL